MTIIETSADMQSWALAQRAAGVRIGCVPTMGYLHAGHLSLVARARAHADRVVLTLFVNPTQFGPNEDLASYPRDAVRDQRLCREAGVDVVFMPQPSDMYAPDHSVAVVEERLGLGLCGASRPVHFRGVCTVVAKLFNLTLPHVAVFGQKDYQQAAIIRRMVRDLNFPIEIIVAPIVREPDGVAMSSRNRNLSADERQRARGLSRALRLAQEACDRGETAADAACTHLRALLEKRYSLRVDYIAVVDGQTLTPTPRLAPGVVVALAVFAGATRLIDNTTLGDPEHGLPETDDAPVAP